MNEQHLNILINTIVYQEWEFNCPCDILNEKFCSHYTRPCECNFKDTKRSFCKKALMKWIKDADALNN